MRRSRDRRYDLRWSRPHLAGLLVLCALAATAMALRAADRTVRLGEVLPVDRVRVAAAAGKINPNVASAASLRRLPGIGPKRAEAIADWRRNHGPVAFRFPEDLADVPGIGDGTVRSVRRYLALPGAAE